MAVVSGTGVMPADDPRPQGVKTRLQVDWKRGALLLVAGHAPAAVAAALHITEERLWKHLAKSLRFQTHIRRAMDRARLLTKIQSGTLQNTVMRDALAGQRDAASLQWLDEVMRKPDAAARDDSGRDAVRQLSETGQRYPSQALRQRLAAERAALEAQVGLRPAANKAEPDSSKPKQASNKPEQDSNKPEQDLNKPEQAPDKTQQRVDKAPIVRPLSGSGPVMPPRSPDPPRISSTVVDITDGEGRPLARASTMDVPAKAGTQGQPPELMALDPRFRGDDDTRVQG